MKTAHVLGAVSKMRNDPRREILGDGGVAAAFGTNVPAYFYAALDVLALTLAFLVAYLLTERIRDFALHAAWFHALVPILAPETGGSIRPVTEASWVLFVAAPALIICQEALGGYRPLCNQTRARIVFTGILAPLMGLGAIAIVLFALRTPTWS